MADYLIKEESLVSIADAIREKVGTTDNFKPSEMAAAIENLNSLPNLNNPATALQVLEGYEIINQNGEIEVGTYNPVPETTSITIDDGQYNYFEHITYTGVVGNEITSIVLTSSDIEYNGYYDFTINNVLKNSTMTIVVGCDLDSYSGCEVVFTQSSADNDYGVIILSNINNASITLVSTRDVMPDF